MPSSYLQKLVWHWQDNPVTLFGRHFDGWGRQHSGASQAYPILTPDQCA